VQQQSTLQCRRQATIRYDVSVKLSSIGETAENDGNGKRTKYADENKR